METDPLLIDGTRKRLAGNYKVRVDLSQLSMTELNHIRLGIDSELERQGRNDGSSRCWLVPAHAVEVFVAK
jgi:hypothetical protein